MWHSSRTSGCLPASEGKEGEQVMRLRITVNGEVLTVSDVEPDERLLAVLREQLGHVEVKDGCSPQGQCGSCTVWLDGKPRAACVIRAEQANGRSVTTP